MSDVQAEVTQELGNTQAEEVLEQQTESTQQEQQTQQPDTSWVPKRISEITAARRAAESRAAELQAELDRMRAERQQPAQQEGQQTQTAAQQSNQSMEQLARSYAEKMVREQRETETLNSKIGAINEAGAKEFGADFDKSVQNLQLAGIGGPEFLRVLSNVDNAATIVTYLGKSENINEAIRIGSLDPVQMGIEMMKMSGKATKAFSKQVSKAPPPIETVASRGNATTDGAEPDPSDHKAWIAWRAKNSRKRR
jgi:hypothetical protein